MKAIIYCRVSTQEQVDEGNSLKTQERLCRQYAKNNKIEIVKPFIEEGESAKSINRPVLQEMMKYCKLQKEDVQAIIIYKIDRLSRDAYDYAGLKAFFSSCGIKVVSVSEPIEDNPVGRFIENTLAGIAQLDNEIRGERSSNGMKEALNEGRYIYTPPYGYNRVGGRGKATIEPDSILAPKIKKLFELILEGYRSYEEVRQKVKEMGLTRSDSKALTKSHFYKIIRNPIYKGYINIPSMGIYLKGTFESIVSSELFEQVQYIISGKSKRLPIYKKLNPDFPLRGIVKCTCGKRMTANWAKKKYGHYRCTVCTNINIPKKDIEENFEQYLETIKLDGKVANLIKLAVKLNWEQQQDQIIKARNDFEIKKAKIKQDQNKVVDKNIAGVFSDSIAKSKLKELEDKLVEVNIELAKYNNPLEDEEELLKYSTKFLTNIKSNWKNPKIDITAQSKLQKWLFPDGLTFVNGELTTNLKPLTIQLNEHFTTQNSSNLDFNRINPNTLSQGIKALTSVFEFLNGMKVMYN